MIDHVSDTFVDPFLPLTRLVASAQLGDSVDKPSSCFLAHADKLIHVKFSFSILRVFVRSQTWYVH